MRPIASRCRIYYHLYQGPSWRPVWQRHAHELSSFARSDALERLIVCVHGETRPDLGLADWPRVEVRHLSSTLHRVNEFSTLAELRRDVVSSAGDFDHCAYLHSKGASAQTPSRDTLDWSAWLSRALAGALPAFPHLSRQGFDTLGSNLALGLFEDFAPPRLHYSGNFWCASRRHLAATPAIDVASPFAAIRHNAEWWLHAGASPSSPFNACSSGVDHYDLHGIGIDWSRLDARLRALGDVPAKPEVARAQIAFLRSMLERAIGARPVSRRAAELLLGALPIRRWPRLANMHHALMQALGSRKSLYVYCAET